MKARAYQHARDMMETLINCPEATKDDVEDRQALSSHKKAMWVTMFLLDKFFRPRIFLQQIY